MRWFLLLALLTASCAYQAPVEPTREVVTGTIKVQRVNTFEPLVVAVQVHNLSTGLTTYWYPNNDGYLLLREHVGDSLLITFAQLSCPPVEMWVIVVKEGFTSTINLGCT